MEFNGVNIHNIDGSATTPSYTFDSDLNTGIYRIGTDNIGIATGGTLAFEIDSNQNVRPVAIHVTAAGAPVGNTIAQADFGSYIYWTAGALNFPSGACAKGTIFTVINNTGSAATPNLGSNNSIASGWTAHAAMDDETARTYIAVGSGSFIYIG